MRTYFLLIGVVVGLFWSQIYAAFASFMNETFVEQPAAVAARQMPAAASPPAAPPKPKTAPKPQPAPVAAASAEQPRVILYATSWCPHCKRARAYFREQGINFVEYDIEKDDQAKRMYDLLGGSGVPLILVSGRKLQGFEPRRFQAMYRGS